MRRLSTFLIALVLAFAMAGLALIPLTAPAFTATLASRFSQAQSAGLTAEQATALAEKARAFVIDFGGAELEVSVDGRTGFDEAAVSHLRDVRTVLAYARIATALLVGIAMVWLLVALVRGRYDRAAAGLRAGGIASMVLVALAAVFAFASFDAFFAWFHSLFFAPGTWMFPADSLLILLFPEQFWMYSGLAWGALIVAGGALLLISARAVAQTGEARARLSAHDVKA